MTTLNRVQLIGRLRDSQVFFSPAGTMCCRFELETFERGMQGMYGMTHAVLCYGDLAQLISRADGTPMVYITGRLAQVDGEVLVVASTLASGLEAKGGATVVGEGVAQ